MGKRSVPEWVSVFTVNFERITGNKGLRPFYAVVNFVTVQFVLGVFDARPYDD